MRCKPSCSKKSGGGEFRLDQKIVKQPADFSGDASDWERFKFSLTTWITIVDSRFPELLKTSAKQRGELESVEMDVGVEKLAGALFAVLVGLCPRGDVPSMARLVPNSNGFELRRRLSQLYEPETSNKPHVWLRALSNPSFPSKEAHWQQGLEAWEAEISSYECETGKTFDADIKLSVLHDVAPKSLAPREFVIAYLKSKNLWKRTQGSSFGPTSATDKHGGGYAPMDVGAVGEEKGKGKGKGKKGDKGDEGGKVDKGGKDKGGRGKGKDMSAEKPYPICGPEKGKNRCLNDCFHDAKSANAKGKGKSKGKDHVHAVGDESTAGASSSSSGGLS